MEYGLQMYSLRDITGEDLKGALEKVAKIGYKGVEFAGFFGHSAEDVKDWLDADGLTVTGTEYSAALDRQAQKPEAVWYEWNETNLNLLFGSVTARSNGES